MPIKKGHNDDVLLLEGIRRCDDRALGSLYDRYSGFLYSVALRILHDQPRAEQVVFDIFLEIWRRPERFDQFGRGLHLPLVLIARNRALAVLRRNASDRDFAVPEWVAYYPVRDITCEAAHTALNKLPSNQWKRLESAFYQGAKRPEDNLLTSTAVSKLAGSGLEVIDLETDAAFARRRLHVRDSILHLQGMNRLARIFVDNSTTILQELATAAVELCGADSAGISVVQENSTEDNYYHWVATAGQYSGFLNAKLPRYPSACGVTLERSRPQIFRASQRFFDLMGVQAPVVTDGLLLPWRVEDVLGTIWIMAHGRKEAFDGEDCRIMEVLSNFAATGVTLQRQQKQLLEQARVAGETAMANSIAHQINNPLQELMQHVYLLSRRDPQSDEFAQKITAEVTRLGEVLSQVLSGT